MVETVRSVCVYCGSSSGQDPAFGEQARRLGNAIADAGLRLVYGGGDSGLMGATARGVLEMGGSVTGIIPTFLVELEQSRGGTGLAGVEMIEVPDMHTRKQMMFEHADAFIALPGGIGTLEELVEILTWSQLARHDKPVLLMDVNGFWSPFVALCDHMEEAGFLHNAARARPHVVADAAAAVEQLTSSGKG